VVEHAKHALGDDVVLDLGRPAIDRGRLAEEPAAHGFQFAVGKLVAFPAQALKAADFNQEFRAFLPQRRADLLEDGTDLGNAALRLAFIDCAARCQQEARPPDFEIRDLVPQDRVGQRSVLIGFAIFLGD